MSTVKLKPCKQCGKEFKGKNQKLYCSDKCKQEHWRFQKAKAKPEPKADSLPKLSQTIRNANRERLNPVGKRVIGYKLVDEHDLIVYYEH